MENNSTSTISPIWPTRWPHNAFNPAWSALLALGIVVVGALVLFASLVALVIVHPAIVTLIRMQSAAVLPFEIVIQAIAEIPIVALVWLALPRLSGFSLRQLGFRVPTLNTIGIACGGALLAIVVSTILGALVDALSHGKHTQEVVKLFLQLHSSQSHVIFALFAIVVGPVTEESVFRLFLFNIGLRYFGFIAAAIGSAILFAAMHMDMYAALPLASAGFIFAWVYYRSRNAFASMMTHALFNAFSFIVLLVDPKLAG